MSIYNWLCLLGVPAVVAALGKYILSRLKQQKEETDALKAGIQALLRDRLLTSFYSYSTRGNITYMEKENWENMYQQYHSLGSNGVMDDIRKDLFDLPLTK